VEHKHQQIKRSIDYYHTTQNKEKKKNLNIQKEISD